MVVRAFDPHEIRERQPLRLSLVDLPDGSVDVVAVDEDGDTLVAGYLLNISERGVFFYPGVDEEFGLPLDDAFDNELMINMEGN